MLCKIYVWISTDTKLQQKVTFKRLCRELNIIFEGLLQKMCTFCTCADSFYIFRS
jgi:hypothetical protein